MLLRVVDASVIVKWFLREDGSEKALILREEHQKGINILIAPDLILAEAANALLFSHVFTSSEIKSCLQTLYEAEIDFIEPSPDLMMLAIELAFKNEITIYDALYIALAEMFDVPFITADKKLFSDIKLSHIKLLSEI